MLALSDQLKGYQSPEVFYKNYRNMHRKSPVLQSLFNKVKGLKASSFIKNRLHYKRFSLNIAKLLKNICKRLLLLFSSNKTINFIKNVALRSSVSEAATVCSVRKDVLRNFAKFTGKHLCQNPFLIKLQASGTEEHLFLLNTSSGCF